MRFSVVVTHGTLPIAKVVGIDASDKRTAISTGIAKVRQEFGLGRHLTLFGEAKEAQPGEKFEPEIRVIDMRRPSGSGD